jgi:site-specific recombinase XerD
MNILEAIEQYKEGLSTDSSHQTYIAALPALKRFFTEEERTDLEVEDITNYRRWLDAEGYAKPTIKLYLVVFRQLLKWMVAKELLDGNFYLRITAYYETMDSGRRSPFVRRQIEPDDIKAILDAFEPVRKSDDNGWEMDYMRNRALVHLLAGTGMRISEALSLDREPFDTFFGNWNGRRELVLPIIGKGEKMRNIVILSSTLRKVRDYLAIRTDNHLPLFVPHGNRHTKDYRITRQTAWASMSNMAKQVGVESFASPHAMRHYYLDRLAPKVDLRTLSDLAGHADVRMTDQAYLGPVRTRELVKAVKAAEAE